jgi:hypothetical protein
MRPPPMPGDQTLVARHVEAHGTVLAFNTAGNSAVIGWRRDILAAGPIANPDKLARLQGCSRGPALRLVRKFKECGVGRDPASHRPTEDQGHQYQSPHVFAPVAPLRNSAGNLARPAAGKARGARRFIRRPPLP